MTQRKSLFLGLLVGLLQTALLLSVGSRLLLDRLHYPRAWARTVPVDPNLPIRGRYVDLQVEVPVIGWSARTSRLAKDEHFIPLQLNIRQDRLFASPSTRKIDGKQEILIPTWRISHLPEGSIAQLPYRLAFFIPPDVPDPSLRPAGEKLWVEVTLPNQGPVRPIQLGVERDGQIEPLSLR